MAKLHGKAKAAFLAKMARGRKKKRRGGKRKTRARRKRRGGFAGAMRRARRAVARRLRGHRKARRRKARRRHRSNPIAYLVNPTGGHSMARRRKHRKHHTGRKHNRRRHRRNPANVGAQVKSLTKLALPALGAGFLGNFVESKFLGSKSMPIRAIGRGVMAVAAGVLLRKNPGAAGAAMGALLGPVGGELGTKMGGGLTVHSTSSPAAVKGLAEAIAGEEDMAALLQSELQGFGVVLQASGGELGHDGAEIDAMAEAEMLEGDEDAA